MDSTPSVAKPTKQDPNIRCPHDSTRMEKEVVGGITIDRCNACGRLWLDDGEMQKLLTSTTSTQTADSGPFGKQSARSALGGRVCPRDGKPLIEVKHPQKQNVLIEVCDGCRGVLLDAGELRQISAEESDSWLSKIHKLVHW